VFSSSEAVDAVRAAMSAHIKVWLAMQRGAAITSHPRIAQRLAAAGFARVAVAPLRADEVIAAIARASRQ
jgi:2-oxo-4-hydroxy-4-carboxy--5-ureidoimidazoline (OHCU) decarboxylase